MGGLMVIGELGNVGAFFEEFAKGCYTPGPDGGVEIGPNRLDRAGRLPAPGIGDGALEGRPTAEAMGAGNDELRIGKRELVAGESCVIGAGQSRVVLPGLLEGIRVAGLELLEEVFGLLSILIEVRPRRELSGLHYELLSWLCLESARFRLKEGS